MCLNHKSESGCKFGDKCRKAGGQPSRKSKKGGAKGSVALLKETIQLGCVSHDSPQRKSILRENGKVGIESHGQLLKDHDASRENSGEEQSIETPKQERCFRRDPKELAMDVYKFKKELKDTFYSPTEAWVTPAPSSTKSEERHFVIDSGKGLELRTVVTTNGKVQTSEEAQVYVHDLHIFVTVEDIPAVLSLGKLDKRARLHV